MKCYKSFIYRKRAAKKEYYYSIYWNGKRGAAVALTGDFTNPPWRASHDLVYSDFYRCFHGIVRMKEGDQFKFLVNGKYEVSADYAVVYVN